MPKLKCHKGLLKRVKLTARGKVKFNNSCTGHLKSHKSGKQLRQLRGKNLIGCSDIGRLRRMLHRPLTPGS